MGNKHQKPKNEIASQPHPQLTVHPFNELKLVDVPAASYKEFKDLVGCVMHFFENVTHCQCNKRKQRVLVITDRAFYCCSETGLIQRCHLVTDVKEILVGGKRELGLILNNSTDMLFEMPADKQQEVAFIIQSIQRAKKLPVAVVTEYTSSVPRERLNLKRPSCTNMEAVTKKDDLARSLQRITHDLQKKGMLNKDTHYSTLSAIVKEVELNRSRPGTTNIRRGRNSVIH
eukprot:TRINITY_DN2517_c0_g2_i1.p1 TRINITY_DN2517_c0_g2~~TRINITY_DN2517_c0_g2_i1.p1  ORF type:complete len:230 (+),score=25.22 TRINITY_DN2517_c0_g2_i1:45-734(+)